MKRLLRKSDGDAEEARREQLARLKLRKLVLAGCGAMVVLFIIAWFSWSYVSSWRQSRDLKKAESYEKSGDYRRALLTLEQLVQIYPLNFEAKRQLASFYERAGQRISLDVWSEAARMEPAVAKNWLGLATAAIRFRDQATAQRALGKLKELGETSVEYRRLAAASAMLSGDTELLELNLTALAEQQPDDERIQLSLAVFRLKSSNPVKSAEGRAALLKLSQQDALRMRAVVELLSDVARRFPANTGEREAVLRDLAAAVAPPEGPRIDMERLTSVDRLVAFAMEQPNPGPEDVAVFLQWMSVNGWSAQALRWLDGLEPALLESQWIKPAIAEAAVQGQDWRRLRALIVAGAWGAIPVEAYDRALELRRVAGKNPPEGLQEWNEIIRLCHSSLPGMRMLVRLAKLWSWSEERQQVLQTVTRDYPREAWAWHELVSEALARRDSELLWRTYYNRSLAIPGDTKLQIESGLIGLMIDHRSAPSAATTQDILRREPNNTGAKILHAFALWRAKRSLEAITLLDSLPAAVFAEPRYALVYGVVLAEVNRARESQQMLEWASAERLLPEESLLIEQARARNATRLSNPLRGE